MNAYEGETVRLKPVCTLCKGEMELGYILDRGDDRFTHQSEWIAGEPRPRRWFEGVDVGKSRRYLVTTLRCEQCGFLASYATTPLNDRN